MTLEEFENKYGENNMCKYCRFNDVCDGDIISNGNGEPVYPPCSELDYESEIDDMLDIPEVIDWD